MNPQALARLDAVVAAVDIAVTRPRDARRAAEAALARSEPELHSVANRVLGLVAWAAGDVPAALRRLRRAVRDGERGGLPVRAAEARMSLAFVLAEDGASAAALAQLRRAAPHLRGGAAARLHMQRALILMDVGRLTESAAGFQESLAALRRAGGHPVLEANIRTNRGILRAYRGQWVPAERDLRAAEVLYLAHGDGRLPATAHHNIGFVAARRGDVPTALTYYDRAETEFQSEGRHPGLLLIDRADALLAVRLVAEARAAAAAAVREYASRRMPASLARARLVLAHAALLDADPVAAAAEAARAGRAFGRQRTPGYAALAQHLRVRADWELGGPTPAGLRAARRSVLALQRTGWVIAAVDAQLLVARIALALGRAAEAERVLTAAATARRRGAADLRAKAWYAEGLRRLAGGDRRGAGAALRAGLRVVDGFQASLGATELRAHTAGHGAELARLGLELALDARRPAAVLEWAERWRAGALTLRPARPPDDAELADELAVLRQLAADVDAALAAGTDPGALLRRQVALEASVRRRTRHAPGAGPGAAAVPVPVLRAAVGEGALVEYLAAGEQLHAVVLTADAIRLQALGPLAPVTAELDALRFGLRRLVNRLGPARSREVIARSVRFAAGQLDALLFGPLRRQLGERELVLIPTGGLHALPWAVLPSCAGRPVSVAPSAALWHRARVAAPGPDGGAVFVAGPGLRHAEQEVAAAAAEQPGARCLVGAAATVAAVGAALDGAGTGHIAAHGQLRADNPLFSALQLADGPLTVYDLERLRRPPRHVVLSACDSGMPTVHAGDELLGLAAALLRAGSVSLVATMTPVDDAVSRDLMLGFHRYRRAGCPAPAALARAQQELRGGGSDVDAALGGFLCFGAGTGAEERVR